MNSTPQRPRTPLRSAIFGHDNDYGTDVWSPNLRAAALSVSCVVPYYETGAIAVECVRRLAQSMRRYRANFGSAPRTQIVVVDDGSTRDPFPDNEISGARLLTLPDNAGRAVARNTGLRESAGFDVVVFVDSDILVADDLITRICELWDAGEPELRTRPVIAATLFSTLRVDPTTVDLDRVVADASITDDWRWTCWYQPSWIGCPGDWMYVGHRFDLLRNTSYFRRWSGMVGPWTLANMVLGGCFAVPGVAASAVGGFDESFATYGYTETSLVARLIAEGIPVVPQVKSAAVHIERHPAHHRQDRRDAMLRTAHRKFFREFLAQ